ncbi:phosphotransferase enzyme family protein [Reinekea sp. G2M2-21]|uniref:phosphotransferase enzyme family protein n=1 Tax=Reinekea sp. G2M2-21 TaxID=2788942 RepID=UPI0018AB9C56|nr:aminoglycoside phosphotransferase family protein [Reinekea sp. G2M2-21]
MEALVEIVEQHLGLNVDTLLPVTESFSSSVLHFMSGGKPYVMKKLFTSAKAVREAHWLTIHSDNHLTPNLIEVDTEQGWILIEARPGRVIQSVEDLDDSQAAQIGQAVASLHTKPADNFDCFGSWHELLFGNMERYAGYLDGEDLDLAKLALRRFNDNLRQIPDSTQAVTVHFDLRPGNILQEGREITGIIDLESMRGGHPSMDFFKLWDEVWTLRPELMQPMLDGYGSTLPEVEDWPSLMKLYRAYHGLGGLAWCAQRNQLDSPFAVKNREFILG